MRSKTRRMARWVTRAPIDIWTGLDAAWRLIRGFVADYPFPAACYLTALVLVVAAR